MADKPRNALAAPIAEMRATPRRNALAGYAADAIGAVDRFARAPFGYENPPVKAASDFLGVPGLQRTLDRLSYGEPLTTGRGQTTRLRDDTIDALGFVPMSPRGALAVLSGGIGADAGIANAVFGPMGRNNMSADYLKGLISSQRFIDRDLVARKIRNKDFTVKVTPEFELDGKTVRAIQDGHHSLEAAIRSGNMPKFVVNTASDNDRIGLLDAGKIDEFLDAAYHDSPWYAYDTKIDIF